MRKLAFKIIYLILIIGLTSCNYDSKNTYQINNISVSESSHPFKNKQYIVEHILQMFGNTLRTNSAQRYVMLSRAGYPNELIYTPSSGSGFAFTPSSAVMARCGLAIQRPLRLDSIAILDPDGNTYLLNRNTNPVTNQHAFSVLTQLAGVPDNIISIAADGNGNLIAITINAAYQIIINPDGTVGHVNLVLEARGDEVFENINYDARGVRFFIRNQETTPGLVEYHVSRDGGTTWEHYQNSYNNRGLDEGIGDIRYINMQRLIFWSFSRISGPSQFEICPTEDLNSRAKYQTTDCINSETTSFEDIAGMDSNFSGASNQNFALIGIGFGGDISRSINLESELELTKHLDVSILEGISYDESGKMFYVIGQDNNKNSVTYVSEDGLLWLNAYVPQFSILASTTNSYCALESTGRISCWGSNDHNKLGLGSEAFTPARALVPAKVGNESWPISYNYLSGGSYHVCALRSDKKSIDCWGAKALGDGVVHDPDYSTPVPTPVKIPTNVELPILSLVGGGTHECLLDSDNQVWCWGDNQYGEIDATSSQQFFPSPVIANYNQVHTYSAIASGDNFTCGLQNKLVICWGKGFSSPTNPLYQITSSAPDFGNFSNISAGGNSTCILSNSVHNGGTNLWCLGDNTYGQLGNGESGPFTLSPQEVRSNVPDSSTHGVKQLSFSKVAQSSLNTCGLDANTSYVYCWGDNTYGQTSVTKTAKIIYEPTSPIQLNGSPGQFTDLSIGAGSICLIANESGDLNTYCLGSNSNGQLGNRSTTDASDLMLVNSIINIESFQPNF